jgi:fumarylacetoacetate (FAA) hydrolase family protein
MRSAEIGLTIEGEDGFSLTATSSMREISRDIEDLVGHAVGPHHAYPDGLALFCGTMFAPVADRGEPGMGFTHKRGDLVSISTGALGTLVNRIELCTEIPLWDFGAGALLRNLSARGLL